MSHSVIPPSKANVWVVCTGYPYMAAAHPEEETESEDRVEGIAAHWVAEEMIRAEAHASSTYLYTVGNTAPNGILINEEIYESAKTFAQDVIAVMHETKVYGGDGFGVEKQVHAVRIHELSFGTPDFFLFDRVNGILYIWDFKNGRRVVEVFENWQAMNYVAAIFDSLGVNGYDDQHIQVRIRIVQPRAYHRDGTIREWKITGSNLRGYFNVLASKAAECLSENKTCTSGPHCRDCSARHACNAAIQGGMQLYEVAERPTPLNMTPEALGVQLSIVKRAIAQLGFVESAFEEQVKGLVRGGMNVPGWGAQPTVGNEEWLKPEDEIEALGECFGIQLSKKKLLTPNQARQAGIDAETIKLYSGRTKKGIKVVPDDGTRAREIFSQ